MDPFETVFEINRIKGGKFHLRIGDAYLHVPGREEHQRVAVGVVGAGGEGSWMECIAEHAPSGP